MARGYTLTEVEGCGRGAAELWSAVLSEYDRRSLDGRPWTIGEIRQVYDRSAYLGFRTEAVDSIDPLGPPLVLLAGPEFDGPLATRIDGGSPTGFTTERLSPEADIRLRLAAESEPNPGYVVSLGETMDIAIDSAAVETPERCPPPYSDLSSITRESAVHDRAVTAIKLLSDHEYVDGLGWLDTFHHDGHKWSLPRELESLIGWWRARLNGPADGPPTDLLGRGPGATPSGDDVLAGLLVALHRASDGRRRRRVNDAGGRLVLAAADRTTDISTALLAQAAKGRAPGPIEAVLGAILAPAATGRRVEPSVLEAAEIGHTSGIDHLVGVLLAITGVAPEIGT